MFLVVIVMDNSGESGDDPVEGGHEDSVPITNDTVLFESLVHSLCICPWIGLGSL